ncbi:hypothetical protein [Xylanivirga thermophila]|uniref:hypothetical protein n=1 Tax=Xylanivirga thermophila TaxID=2496273 RepID=UPI00101CB9DB|nr:hypothetical protein [Xylanivirga thermophila]
MENKSKFRNIIIILLLFILLFPIPMRLKDGGSIRFQALLYSVTKVHRLNNDSEAVNEFLKGWKVEVLNLKVYSNVK